MNFDAMAPKTSRRVERRLSEVEREIAAADNLCWQCDEPLGTTEACLTCAAKRAEALERAATTPACASPGGEHVMRPEDPVQPTLDALRRGR